MKKKVVILSLALMLMAVGVVSAATNWGKFEGYSIVRLVINGDTVVPKDTPPVILKGRTMVPLAMLEEAGVRAEWDPETYSVLVTTADNVVSSDSQFMDYFLVMDYFKSIDDLGEAFVDVAGSLSTAFRGVYEFDDIKSVDNARKYLDSKIEGYNYYVEKIKTDQEFLRKLGVESDIVDAMNHYYDAIESFKTCLNIIETYYYNPTNTSAMNDYFDILEDGSDSAFKGIDICINGYYEFRNLILEQ